MDVFFSTLLTGTNQGLLWAIMAIGIYISYRILDFADLTVEGSFASGGATSAIIMTLAKDFVAKSPGAGVFIAFISIICAVLVGGLAGLITGLLNTKLKIAPILSGILTMTGLYSVNLMIMGIGSGGAKNNVALGAIGTLFTKIGEVINIGKNYIVIIIGIVVVAAVIAILYWFLGTEVGSAMRATGNNEKMAKAQGINTQNSKILGLVVSNALVALSGALVAHQQANASVTMGVGSLVIGLAAIIIGESIISAKFPFWARLLSIVIGSVIYRIIISFIFLAGVNSEYIKLMSAILVIVILAIPLIKEQIKKIIKKKNGSNSYNKSNTVQDAEDSQNDDKQSENVVESSSTKEA